MVRRELEMRSSMPSGEATLTDKCDGGAYPPSYSSCGLDRLAIASYSYVFSWRGIIVGRGSAERPTIWISLFMGRLLCYGVLLFSVRPLDQRGRERERAERSTATSTAYRNPSPTTVPVTMAVQKADRVCFIMFFQCEMRQNSASPLFMVN